MRWNQPTHLAASQKMCQRWNWLKVTFHVPQKIGQIWIQLIHLALVAALQKMGQRWNWLKVTFHVPQKLGQIWIQLIHLALVAALQKNGSEVELA